MVGLRGREAARSSARSAGTDSDGHGAQSTQLSGALGSDPRDHSADRVTHHHIAVP